MTRYAFVLMLVGLPAAAAAGGSPAKPGAPPPETHIDGDADRLLRQMTDYLAGLQNFEVTSSTVDEVVTKDGRKIEIAGDHDVSVARPSRLRSAQIGASNGLSFTDDGKTMTVYCNGNNEYASAPSPATIDATVDALHKQYQLDAPGADLLYSHPYDVLTEQVTAGQLIGKETIDGVLANHLAFQGQEVDWQVWVQDGPQPLPLRYVITSKTMKDEPEFTVRLSHWQPHAPLADSVFKFQAPPGAKKVAAFPISCPKSP